MICMSSKDFSKFFHHASMEEVAQINLKLARLIHQGEHIMATVQQVKDAVVAEALEVKTRVDELAAEIQGLKDQLGNGGTITEAQLDEVLTAVQNIFTPGASVPPNPTVPADVQARVTALVSKVQDLKNIVVSGGGSVTASEMGDVLVAVRAIFSPANLPSVVVKARLDALELQVGGLSGGIANGVSPTEPQLAALLAAVQAIL